MKMSTRKFFWLFFALIFLFSAYAAAGELAVPFVTGDAAVKSGSGGVRVEISGFCSFLSPGDPALPFVEKRILLPPNADLNTLRIELRNAKISRTFVKTDILPTPPISSVINGRRVEWWGKGKQIVNGKNMLVYGKNSLYPADYVQIVSTERLGRYFMAVLRFWPYRINPALKELRHVERADVVLSYKLVSKAAAALSESPNTAVRVKNLVLNGGELALWYPKPQNKLTDYSPIPLAIITTSAIAQSSAKLAAFAAHKNSHGYQVQIVTETQWGGGNGDTAAENIRAWIRSNYPSNVQAVILIGSPNPASGDVPMKMLWPRRGAGDGYEEAPSDYYYADITGNWDLDADGYYGEYPDDFGVGGVDRLAEVVVGRIPYYGSISALDKILQKIIDYESMQTVGAWAQRMIIAMKPLDDITPLWNLGESIRNDAAKPAGFGCLRIYEDTYNLSPPPEFSPCVEDTVKSEWQKRYGFVFWSTHGSADTASGVFSSSSCQYLDDSAPSFVFQGACSNGYPESSNNLGFSVLANGGIGVISASRVSWYYPGQVDFNYTDSIGGMERLYAIKMVKDRQSAGSALYDMKSSLPLTIWMNHVVFNLYGDPTVLPQWPTAFNIQTESLPDGFEGGVYAVDLCASGGAIPYTWRIIGGRLPDGLELSASGTISGTPTRQGRYWFTVESSDGSQQVRTKQLSITIIVSAYSFSLNTKPDWICEGGWEFGIPSGQGSHNRDPRSGYTGSFVFGYNLNGDYPNDMPAAEYLTTSAFDLSAFTNVLLRFRRWLGVESSIYDKANIQISNDGSNWATVWSNPQTAVQDTSWVLQVLDISSFANLQPAVFIRWGMGTTDSSASYPGWNLDDIEICGLRHQQVLNITALKSLPDGTPVMLSDHLVSAVYEGSFYVQETDVPQGIKVIWSGSVDEGSVVSVRGVLRTSSGEREIAAESVLVR